MPSKKSKMSSPTKASPASSRSRSSEKKEPPKDVSPGPLDLPSMPLTFRKAAERWGMSQQTVRLLHRTKKLRAFRIGGGRWRIPPEEIERVEKEGYR